MKVGWTLREPPLAAVAVVARGDVARRLVDRLLAEDDAALAGLQGVAGPGIVVVSGPSLPWVDGVSYLGRDPEAPALWLPTTRRPSVPVDWLQGAVLRRCAEGASPVAVLAEPFALVPTGASRPLVRARLVAL